MKTLILFDFESLVNRSMSDVFHGMIDEIALKIPEINKRTKIDTSLTKGDILYLAMEQDIAWLTKDEAYFTYLQHILKAIDINCDVNTVLSCYLKVLKEKATVNSKLIDFLKELRSKGHTIGIYGNATYTELKLLKEYTGDLFDDNIFLSCETGLYGLRDESFLFVELEYDRIIYFTEDFATMMATENLKKWKRHQMDFKYTSDEDIKKLIENYIK